MTYNSEVLADSPLLYWRLNETSGTAIGDSSGNSRTGTYTSLTTAAGLITSDADTAATNPLGSIASASWMNTNEFTAEALIKPSTLNSGTFYLFGRNLNASTGSGAGAADWSLDITNSKLRLVFLIQSAPTTYQVVTGATTLVTGTIYHVAASYDGLVARLYLNGVVDASLTLTGATKQAPTDIYIGNASIGASAFAGVMDEFAVYGTGLTTRMAAHSTAAFAAASRSIAPIRRPLRGLIVR